MDDYLSMGWIRPRTSPYGAPILFAKTKDDTLRMCIDYRALNQKTRPDKYLLPRIDGLLNQLAITHSLSSIDL